MTTPVDHKMSTSVGHKMSKSVGHKMSTSVDHKMSTSVGHKMLRENKNLNPKVGSKNEGRDPHSNDGRCKMLEILNTKECIMWDASVLKDLANVFNECVLMYNDGEITIFLSLPSNIVERMRATCQAIKHISHRIEDVYMFYKTFMVFKNTVGDMLVIPRKSNVNIMFHMFDDFRRQHYKSASVCVKLEDIYEIVKNSKCSECLDSYIHYDSEKCIKCFQTDREETDSGANSFHQENMNTRHVSVRHSKKKNEKVKLPNLIKESADPFYGENAHSSTQVSADEQRKTNHKEYAISSDHSSLLPSSNYGFTTSKEKPGDRRPRYPEYADFRERMMSYAHWVHGKPDPTSLSEAGFFFTNESDLVRCYQCGIGLKDFSEDDDPLLEHVRHSENCLYLFETLGATRLTILKSKLQNTDPDYNRRVQLEHRNKLSLPGLLKNYRHPEYQTRESRIASFVNWPSELTQTPERLADAGLFYTGYEDFVRCFACDGGLKRWDADDDPWTEHCRWFPACPFAREQKGEHYIALVQAAVAFEHENAGSATAGGELTGAMEQMTLRDPEYRKALQENKEICLEMGFEESDINEAIQELRHRGTIKPTVEELVETTAIVTERRQQKREAEARQNETPLEENQRLRRSLFCMTCDKNNVNALFLPCTHHRLCMECAETLTKCPICDRKIRQKIKTYLV